MRGINKAVCLDHLDNALAPVFCSKTMKNIICLMLLFPLTALADWRELTNLELKQRVSELTPKTWSGVASEKAVKSFLGCDISDVTIEVTDQSDKTWNFTFNLIRPKHLKKTPVVILLPTIERLTPLEPSIAWQLCDSGYSTLFVDANDNSQPSELPAWNHESKVLRRTILTLRTILDWAHADQRFYKNRVGLFGHSLGGITASLMASLEAKRLKAVVMVVGGGNMPGILASSIYPRVALLRWRRMWHTGNFSNEDYESKMQKKMRYEPLFFAKKVKTESLYFVMAAWDRSVPYEYQLETHQAFGSPEYHLFSPGAHIDGLIRLATIDFHKVEAFLDSKLK
jgi:dienelactone hydrolase